MHDNPEHADIIATAHNGQQFRMRVYAVVRPPADPSQYEVVLVEEGAPSLARKGILAIGRADTLSAAISDACARVWTIQ